MYPRVHGAYTPATHLQCRAPHHPCPVQVWPCANRPQPAPHRAGSAAEAAVQEEPCLSQAAFVETREAAALAENGFRRAVRFAAAESPAISVSDGVMDAFCPITTGSSASGHRRYAPLTAIKRTAPPSAHCRMEISRNDALHRSITRSLPKHRKGLLHEVFASYSSLSLRPCHRTRSPP